MCSCVGLGLGIGFREWVPIRNIIGGAAGAHIPMTLGLPLSACVEMGGPQPHKIFNKLEKRKPIRRLQSACVVRIK